MEPIAVSFNMLDLSQIMQNIKLFHNKEIIKKNSFL